MDRTKRWERTCKMRTSEYVVRLVGTMTVSTTVDVICQGPDEAKQLAATAFQALLDDVEKPGCYDSFDVEVEAVDVAPRADEPQKGDIA